MKKKENADEKIKDKFDVDEGLFRAGIVVGIILGSPLLIRKIVTIQQKD